MDDVLLYLVELQGLHKIRRQELSMTFVTIATSEEEAIEKVKEWFDISGIKIESFKAWPSDTQAFNLSTTWGV